MKLRKIANNVTELVLDSKTILISYETPVAVQYHNSYNLVKTSKKWSATTQRHINSWLDGRSCDEEPQSYFDDMLNAANA